MALQKIQLCISHEKSSLQRVYVWFLFFVFAAKLKRMLEMLNAMQKNSMQRIYLFEHFRAFEYAIFVCNYFRSSKITKCISQMFTLASFQSLACMDWASAQSVASIIGGMSDYRTKWFSIRLIYRAWVDFVCRFVAIRMQLYTFWNSSSDIRGMFLERDRERERNSSNNQYHLRIWYWL